MFGDVVIKLGCPFLKKKLNLVFHWFIRHIHIWLVNGQKCEENTQISASSDSLTAFTLLNDRA